MYRYDPTIGAFPPTTDERVQRSASGATGHIIYINCASIALQRMPQCAYAAPTRPSTNVPAEDSYSVTRTIDGVSYFLMLTDTAGQEEYRSLWAASNLRSDAFLLVYDITNPYSLDGLEYFIEMIDMEEENRIDQGKCPPVKIVAGNKCDLQGGRQIRSQEGLEWARRRGCGFMETSAREMVNIEETFARE